jgi:hypothetical protein
MRDAYKLKGQTISYKKEKYEIGDIYFIPNNPELFIQLKKDGDNLNVKLKDITPIDISIKKLR